MTLDRVDQMVYEIQDAAATNSDKAISLRNDLFTLLLKRDEFYLVPAVPNEDQSLIQQKVFRPLASPATSDDPHMYLRVFSDPELARKAGTPVLFTSMELIQLIKFWFLRGVSGILLNDGAAWLVIPIPALSDLFCDIAGIQGSDSDYVAIVELANDIRINSFSRILCQNTGHSMIFVHEADAIEGAVPATMKNLFSVDKEVITPDRHAVSKEKVLAIMEEVGGGDDVLR